MVMGDADDGGRFVTSPELSQSYDFGTALVPSPSVVKTVIFYET